MNERKKRTYLFVCLFFVVAILAVFLRITFLSYTEEIQNTLNNVLIVISVIAAVILFAFTFFADVFEKDGSFQKISIIMMTISILCVMQLSLFFVAYAYQQLEFNNTSLNNATECYNQIITDYRSKTLDLSKIEMPKEIEKIYITDRDNIVLYSTVENVGEKIETNAVDSYRFELSNSRIIMYISKEYRNSMIFNIIIELVTVMATSVILSVELILFVIKFIEDKFIPKDAFKKSPQMIKYVRQIAFLFYFASRMGTPFITILAKELGGTFLGIEGNILAGIPQSAEFLLTCVAIFFTSILIEKCGWKMSFGGGLAIVVAGTVMSALSPNIGFFIVSRAVVGLGYGFCWMTLRNFALFAETEGEKTVCFALLNAGIYAGMNCGAVIGGILADVIGFVPTLIISAVLTGVSFAAIIKLKNVKYEHHAVVAEKKTESVSKLPASAAIYAVLFIILMVVPSCILGSYLGYYLPIYFSDLGRGASNVGKMQLIYGLIIVYLGPLLTKFLVKFPKMIVWNLFYNVLFSVALIIFGLIGGIVPAILAVVMIGLSDSFGFVSQNNYFLSLKLINRLGASKAFSYVSIIKKLSEMLGPIAFGVMFVFGSTFGVAVLGILFLVASILFMVTIKLNRR